MPHSLYATDTDLTADNLLRLPAEFGCPVWVYDAQIIRRQIAQLSQFDVVRFAQKACSNIHILRLMREQGVKVDSVSLGEIERALAAGYDPQQNPEDIVFTAVISRCFFLYFWLYYSYFISFYCTAFHNFFNASFYHFIFVIKFFHNNFFLIFIQDFYIKTNTLKFFEQYLEGLRYTWFRDVFAFNDFFVCFHTTNNVVRLNS